MTDDRYPLRERDREEIDRLGLQHEVWHRETSRAIEAGAFKAGDDVADLGCGPGFLSVDLAGVVADGDPGGALGDLPDRRIGDDLAGLLGEAL